MSKYAVRHAEKMEYLCRGGFRGKHPPFGILNFIIIIIILNHLDIIPNV